MKRTTFILCAVLLTTFTASARSMFIHMKLTEVPIESLIKTYRTHIKQNPKDRDAHYIFGRVCSMAYAQNLNTVPVSLKDYHNPPASYPTLNPHQRFPLGEKVEKSQKPLPKRLEYMRLAITHYREATLLKAERDESYALLGYAWTVEQGITYADQIPAPFDPKQGKVKKERWIEESLKAYRIVYATESKAQGRNHNFPDPAAEAGQSIMRLLKEHKKPLSAGDKVEIASIEKKLPELEKRPGWITPIILPLSAQTSFKHLTSNPKRTHFDMVGDGIKRNWSWVTPDTGILVWNPRGKNRITSGYQLFGQVTWCIFWKNGYEPLAALDGNGDDWLTGKELAGIGVWQDKNGNGVSDKGEVKTLRQWGLVRIAVKGHSKVGGVLSNSKGIVKSDGTTLPTYDWIANSK